MFYWPCIQKSTILTPKLFGPIFNEKKVLEKICGSLYYFLERILFFFNPPFASRSLIHNNTPSLYV